MKNKLLNVIIIILLFLVAGAFYLYWGTEKKEPNINIELVDGNDNIAGEEENKFKEYNKKYSEMVKKVQSVDRRGELEKEEEKMIKKLVEPSFISVSEVEEKAEEVYAELLPDEFDSDVEIMDEALNELDIKSDEIGNKLMQEELTMNIGSNENNENLDELENSEQVLPAPSEDEIVNNDESDIDAEDVNNLEDSEPIEVVETESFEEELDSESLIDEGVENEVI